MARIKYFNPKTGKWEYADSRYVVDSGGNVELDTTLTQSGKAADAKAVGDKIAEITGISLVEPADNDIPKVYFTGTLPTSKAEDDVQLTMHYISKTADFIYPVTLKVQGSSSVNYAKKNFTLKPYKDSTYEKKQKLTFKNWPEMNKFVLKAHWIDHSHVRNVGTAKIWGKIVESRSDYASLPEELRNSPNNGATDGFTCKVFCNGVYQGLYEWIVPKDKLFGQDSDIATHSILNSELNNQPTCAFATTSPTMNGNWSEELQDSLSSDISASFANLIKFVAGSTDEEFVANAETYFDVQSVIDFDIFARVFCIVDNLCRNQIFFTYNGVKWYEGCWDVDAVLGLPPTTRGFFAYNTEFQTGYIAYKDYGVTNLLYQRVETLFMDRFKARYAELRSGVLSIENIIDVYERLTDTITTYDGLLAEDYASTTGGGAFTGIPYTSQNNIQQIRTFVSQRIPYMDEVIEAMAEALPCTGITLSASELTFTAEGSQTLTATVTPDGCTDAITWESNNTSVATVNGGVVTAVANGSATITVHCGEYSASCSVVVSGIGAKTYYSVTNTLENCTNSNGVTTVAEGSSYSAKITADSGYKLKNVTVTHNGENVTVNDGVITIDNVTGDIVIIANAEEHSVLYELNEPTTFDGTANSIISTGVAPYAVEQDITIAFDFVSDGNNASLDCLYRCGEYKVQNWSGWKVTFGGGTNVLIGAESAGFGAKIVVVRNSTERVFKVYGVDVNGDNLTNIGTGYTSSAADLVTSNQILEIGTNSGYDNHYFSGTVNSFIIDKKVWTDEEINAYLN